MWTSPWMVALRGITRRIGLNRLLGRWLANGRYEDRFGPCVQAEVRAGDTVWDIGANLGLYTQAFLQRVGAKGRVVAFEPVPTCFLALRERFANVPNVLPFNLAVGDGDGAINMSLDADPLAATHRVVSSAQGRKTISVEVRSAGSIARVHPELFPDLVKIDVEGHEGAVLDGMRDLLSNQRLRCIGIEVHFGLLEERGEAHRPRQMEETLAKHGFQVRWTDPSHLLAVR